MRYQRDHRKDDEQVDEESTDMEYEEATGPEQDENECKKKKHDGPPYGNQSENRTQ